MLKNIFENKKIFIAIIAAIVAVIVIVGIAMNQDSEDDGETKNDNIKTEQSGLPNDKDNDSAVDDKEDEINENGLVIKEDTTGTVIDSIDGSGSWEDNSEDNKKEESQSTTSQDQGNQSGNKDVNAEEEDEDGMADEDVLVDEKEWSDIR